MPDKYGRMTFEDGMGLAMNAMTMDANKKKGELYDAQLEEANRVKQDREQVGQGISALKGGASEKPEGVSEQNWLEAQKGHSEGADLKFKTDVRSKANEFIPVLQANGYNFDALKPTDSAGIAAVADLAKTFSETEQGKNVLAQNRGELLTRKYGEFQAGKQQVDRLLKEGNTEAAIAGIEQLTKSSPMPYHLDDYDAKTQTFSVKYLESKGTPQETQRIGLKDVMQTLNATGEKQFFQQGAMHAAAIRKSNMEYRMDPAKHLRAKTKQGQAVTVVPQKNINDLTDIDYLVYPENGGDPYTIRSMAALKKAGIEFEDLDREKALASIASTKQSTATSRANEGLYHAKAANVGAEKTEKITKQARDAFSDMAKMLKDVKDGEGNTFNIMDADAMDAASPELRKPFMQKVVELTQDKTLSPEARSTAQRYLQLGQKLGYIQQAMPQEVGELKAAYQRLLKSGVPAPQAREQILNGNPQYRGLLTGKDQPANRPH